MPDKEIVRWEVSKKTGNRRPVYSDGTYGPVVQASPGGPNKTSSNPDDLSEKARIASTTPDKTVSDEQFAELEDLYYKARAQKHGSAVLEFQKKYHELLPDEAKRIIASDPRRTNKAKAEALTSYDLKSNEDSYFGPRTEQYWQGLQKYKGKPAPKVDVKLPAEKTAEPAARKDFERNPIQEQPVVPGDQPWWLQDIINTAGAAGDFFRVKKYNPWQATPGVTYPNPTFYDPTRELAASAEQTKIGADAVAQFTGPQAFNARFSQLQGQGFKNAADIMGRYNNLNVGVANQFAVNNANTANQDSQNKARLNTELYDKYTIANQQFDNAKNMARQNLRNQYIHAITNKNYTQNLNQMYPQFAVDPSVGGLMHFTKGRDLNGNEPEMDLSKMYQDVLHANPNLAATESGQKIAWDMVKAKTGIKDKNQVDPQLAAMMGFPGY